MNSDTKTNIKKKRKETHWQMLQLQQPWHLGHVQSATCPTTSGDFNPRMQNQKLSS